MQLEFISIHAPTRGATSSVKSNSSPITFQSTLPRGERPSSGIWLSSPFHFNPRSHEGSDLPECAGGTDQVSISIHAPTRGATREQEKRVEQLKISIHAPTRGATVERVRFILINRFQSTLPRGERLQGPQGVQGLQDFNPRSHEGSDTSYPESFLLHQNFNPRSHEGSDSNFI